MMLMKIRNKLMPGLDKELIYRLSIHRPTLTLTEINIAGLVYRGCTSKEIADRLGCSVRNIENHRYRIGKKLQIDRAAVMRSIIFQAVGPALQ
jgi:DNA-binding CsgD family transcriptional regulator